jgi:hypothetical protein
VSLDSEFGVLSEGSYVGSTAVVVLLSSMRLWVAHAGGAGLHAFQSLKPTKLMISDIKDNRCVFDC